MKKIFAAAALAITIGMIGVSALPQEQAQTSATAWLTLVDGRKYDQSWTETSSIFRTMFKKPDWAAKAAQVRDPLGAVTSRKHLNTTLANSLPGVPDGEYAVLRFDTSFAKKAKAVETVTLKVEEGKWKVAGYFVR